MADDLPRFQIAPPSPRAPSGIVGPGLRAGFNELQGVMGNAAAAAGTYYNAPGLTQRGEAYADRNFAEAQAAGRPDLETAPWREGGAPFLPYVGYQITKNLPLMGGIGAATLVSPVVGGAAALAGTSALGAGSVYGEARDRAEAGGAPVTREDAAAAFRSAPFYGAAETLVPFGLGKVARGARVAGLGKGTKLGFTANAAAGGFVAEAATEGVQTALELQVRPDLTWQEKSERIVDAALIGGLVGGTLGGVAGGAGAFKEQALRETSRMDMQKMSEVEMDDFVSTQLDLEGPKQLEAPRKQLALPPPEAFPENIPTAAERSTPLASDPPELLAVDVQNLANKVRGDQATPEDFVTLDAVVAELTERAQARAQQTGRPVVLPDAVVEAQVVERDAIERTRAQVVKIVGRKTQLTDTLQARNMFEAGAAVLQRLEAGDTTSGVMALAETLGLVNEQGLSITERNIPAERAARQADVTRAEQELRVAKTEPEQVKAQGTLDAAIAAAEKLGTEADFALRVQQLVETDPVSAVEAFRSRNERAVTPAAPVAPLALQAPLTRDVRDVTDSQVPVITPPREAPSGLLGAPVEPSSFEAAPATATPTALADALAPIQSQLGQREQQTQDYDAATVQQAQQSKQALAARTDAMIEWDRRNENADGQLGTTSFEQLKPEAQREWMAAVARGTGQAETFKRLRGYKGRKSRIPATTFAEGSTLQPVEDPNVAPVVTRRATGGARDVTLPSGRQVGMTYVRGKLSGWYIEGLEGVPEGLLAKANAEAAATNLRDMAAAGPLPAGVSLNPTNGVRFKEGREISNPVEKADIQEDVAARFAGWGLNVTVGNSVYDLPPAVRAKVIAAGQERAMAMLVGGKDIYVLANNVSTRKEAIAAVYHEALGHKGLAQQFGTQLDAELMRMYQGNKDLRTQADDWLFANPEAYKDDKNQRARAVEEILAQRSEQGIIESEWFDRLKALVKRFLAKLGLKTTMTDREVIAILSMAHAKAVGDVRQERTDGVRYMYVGQQPLSPWSKQPVSRTRARQLQQQLENARKAQRQGTPMGVIRLRTGWHVSALDGKWRYEIADDVATTVEARELPIVNSDANIARDALKLREVMDHPDLYALYPHLGEMRVAAREFSDPNQQGAFIAGANAILVNPTQDAAMLKETLLHEAQHYIQHAEGWQSGGSPAVVLNLLTPEQRTRLVSRLLEQTGIRVAALRTAADIFDALEGTPIWGRWQTLRQAERTTPAAQQEYDDVWEQVLSETPLENFYSPEAQALFDTVAAAVGTKNLGAKARSAALMLDRNALALKSGSDSALVRLASNSRELYYAYRSIAGEIEANDTGARARMTEAERRSSVPGVLGRTVQASDGTTQVISDADVIRRENRGESASIASANAGFKANQKASDKAWAALKTVKTGAAPALRKAALYVSSLTHIESQWGKLFANATGNAISHLVNAYRFRVTVEQRMSNMSLRPFHDYEQFARDNPDAAEKVRFLMGISQFGGDPRKPYSQQTWLKEGDKATREKVRQHVTRANQIYSNLKKAGHASVYDNFVAVNEGMYYAQHTMALWNQLSSNPVQAENVLKGATNPMHAFVQSRDRLHETPAAARKFWESQWSTLQRTASEFSANQRKSLEKMTTTEARKLTTHLGNLETQLRDSSRALEAMLQAPYFHLGRFGKYYTAFHIRSVETRDENGKPQFKVDQAAVRAVAKKLDDAGYTGIEITEGTDRQNVFIRSEKESESIAIYELALEMQAEGLLDPRPEVAPARDMITSPGGYDVKAEAWAGEFLSYVQGSEAFETDPTMTDEQKAQTLATKGKFEGVVRQFMFDKLPDTSLAKVMTHRKSVPGFRSDMVRSYAYRSQLAARSLATITASPGMISAFGEMQAAVKSARRDPDAKVFEMRDVMTELQVREQKRPDDSNRGFVQTLRAVNHAYFLGMSPAYFLTNITQIGVLLLPHLTKRYGYVKSLKATSSASGQAFKVFGGAFTDAWKAEKFSGIVDLTITPESLAAAGFDQRKQDYMMWVINTGMIDLGSASRELGRIPEGKNNSGGEAALRYASAFGLWSEIITRATAAIAEYDLAVAKGDTDLETIQQRAVATIDQSMLNYSTWNVSRMSGAGGPAGQFTPLALSFMQYTFQLMEKLYREAYAGFISSADTKEEKAAARRFIYSHLGAVTTLAGSLGLPLAVPLARAFDEIGDLFADEGEEPTDVVTAYRTFLADTFGKDVAEVMARGLPRAIGIDMSVRAGEQGILPFSRTLSDKRDFETVIKETAIRAFGSPLGMVTNMITGGAEMAKGDFIEGSKKFMPVFMKGPIEAIRMTDKGYVDKAGNVLPMEVGAANILAQILGFGSSERAEYREVDFANTVRTQQLSTTASRMRKNIAQAFEARDMGTFRQLMRDAEAFDRHNPQFGVRKGVADTLKARARARALSDVSKLPIGVNPNDPGVLGKAFGNY